jgi:TRAP-type mannitol/chloroaromatic compound transport system substrate-binding protein
MFLIHIVYSAFIWHKRSYPKRITLLRQTMSTRFFTAFFLGNANLTVIVCQSVWKELREEYEEKIFFVSCVSAEISILVQNYF